MIKTNGDRAAAFGIILFLTHLTQRMLVSQGIELTDSARWGWFIAACIIGVWVCWPKKAKQE